jgi:hypothetical protein
MGKGKRRRAALLLRDVAAALNACRESGITVHLKHDTVFTDVGYVLDTGTEWVPRTLAYVPFDDDRDDKDPSGRTSVWPLPSPPSTAQS